MRWQPVRISTLWPKLASRECGFAFIETYSYLYQDLDGRIMAVGKNSTARGWGVNH